jgi:ABC-type amino acid transport substrate-binding protein
MPRRNHILPGRRGLLRTGLAVAASALTAPARAGTHDRAFRRILATGRIRFGCATATAQLSPPPGSAPHDPFHTELAARIAGILGLRHSVEPHGRTFAALQQLLDGQVDVLLGAALTPLSIRWMMFTPPYAELETVVLSAHVARRPRLQDWAGLRLGMQEGFGAALTSLGFDLRGLHIAAVADLAALEAGLLAGTLDAVITTSVTARSLIARNPAHGFRMRARLIAHLHGASVRFGEHELLRAVSAALREVRDSGELAHLFGQHTGAPLLLPAGGA